LFSHKVRGIEYVVEYRRELLLKSEAEISEEFRRLYGLHAQARERVRSSWPSGGQQWVFIQAENREGTRAWGYLSGVEMVRRRPLVFGWRGPVSEAQGVSDLLQAWVETFEAAGP
jgi:hypothetical protein